MTSLKKAILVFITAVIVAAPFQHAQAQTAGAAAAATCSVACVKVIDPANFAVEEEEAFVTNILNGIAWAAAKAVVQSITQSLVQWINSGFEGSPAFVTNLQHSLLQVADGVATDFLFDLGKTDQISMPWGDALQEGIALGYYLYTSPNRLQSQLRYTLASFSSNPQAYLFGDFRYGGWHAWYGANSYCGNNPYCSQLAAHDELVRRLDTYIGQFITETYEGGRGFLQWRGPCQKFAGGTTTNEDNEAVPLTENEGGGKCLEYSIRTPGSIIEDSLANQLHSGVRQLELADSINEIIGALAAQLVTQVLGESGLLGTTQASSGGGRSYIQQIVDNQNDTTNNPALPRNLAEEVEDYTVQVTTYRTSWLAIQTAAQAAKEELESCLSDNNNDEVLAQQVEPVLAAATAAIADADAALVELERIATTVDTAENVGVLVTLAGDFERVQQAVTIDEVADATAEAGVVGQTTVTEMQEIVATACD